MFAEVEPLAGGATGVQSRFTETRITLARPYSVANELRRLKERFQPDHVWLADDIFALSYRWTLEFADAVQSLNARVPFKMQSRCDLMTRETVKTPGYIGCEKSAAPWDSSLPVIQAQQSGFDKPLAACRTRLIVRQRTSRLLPEEYSARQIGQRVRNLCKYTSHQNRLVC